MKRILKNNLSVVLAIWMLFAVCPSALAAERQPNAFRSGKEGVTFSGLLLLESGESIAYETTGPDGSKAVIGITRVENHMRTVGEVWQVWYTWLANHVEFYMTVNDNKVTSVYDYSISLIGSTYEDARLTKTTTYGKLTFEQISLGGLAASTCWLKGTVTGKNNDIDVTWQM